VTAAATRGELASQRLKYLAAAEHLAEAAKIAPEPEAVLDYQWCRADALYRHGDEFGDNAALAEAIRVWREVVAPLVPRERAPLDWAMTQMNLVAALRILGEREAGTARLEEAVAAYHAALEEWTRERVPLQWAVSTGAEGVALTIIAERTADPAMAERAVEQITTAYNVVWEGGHMLWVAYLEESLEAAEAVRDALPGADAAAR
jgi:tetratricopeptide (TPR) repeat protein